MAESVIYLRAPFPFPPTVGIPERLIRDARVLLNLTPAQLDAAVGQLEAFDGFLDQSNIQQALAAAIEDQQACEALARLIANVDRRLRDFRQTVDELLSQIGEWLAGEENRRLALLSPEEFEQLKQRMPIVIRRFPGLNRQAKAQRLSQATGLPLEKVHIICDLRPVFDKDHDRVEGMIPYTTLRIVCKGADGLPIAMEAILTRQDVKELAKASANAEKKLDRLHELLRERKVSIPRVEMTMEVPQK